MTKRAQTELDSFFSQLYQLPKDIRSVTGSAFTQCREKISFQAFYQALLKLNRFYLSHNKLSTYHGKLLVAIDGTVLTVPKNKNTLAYFGDNVLSKSGKWLKAQVSFACAVDSMLCLDAQIDAYKESEKNQAFKLFKNLPKNCLLLFDRGYFSIEFLYRVFHAGHSFCFRLKSNANKEIENFIKSTITNQIMEFTYQDTTIKARLTKVTLDTGEEEYLLTDLFDQKVFTPEELKALYHKRWMVEEQYKDFKHSIAVENFVGRKTNAILQEFYGNILLYNLSMMLFKQEVDREVQKKSTKYHYKANKSAILAKVKQCFVDIFFDVKNRLGILIENIIKCLIQEAIPIRNGRKYPRGITFKAKRKFSRAYVAVS